MNALLTDSLPSDGLLERREEYGEVHERAFSMQTVRTAARVRGALAPWQINLVDAFIEQHLTEPIRVGDLSAAVTRRASYFAAAFRRTFGTSPRGYILRRRVQTAVDLMTAGDAPLSEIALMCGFADQPHFTRHFRRLMGATPAAWRRARRVRGGDVRLATLVTEGYGRENHV
jgi:AraC-like DNA-binding protein